MGVFIDDLVRVEFHLEEATVSLVSMGEQIDGHLTLPLCMSLSHAITEH
jgi:hypothetical protein